MWYGLGLNQQPSYHFILYLLVYLPLSMSNNNNYQKHLLDVLSKQQLSCIKLMTIILFNCNFHLKLNILSSSNL